MKKIIKIKYQDQNLRLDKWLKNNFSSLKQGFIEKNIRKKNILINSAKTNANYRLINNDIVTIFKYDETSYKHISLNKKYIIPKNIKEIYKDSILYEDKNFIILDKWSGISTQGGSKINISIDHVIKNISPSYNLVHRLDKETSGLLVIAKNIEYTKIFGNLFKFQKIQKKYLAICQGRPNIFESNLNLEIPNKEKNNSTHQTETYYKVLSYNKNLSMILFIPKTGKTHQLRIVSKNLGCPIVGDKKYNNEQKYKNEILKLNAHIINFIINDKEYNFKSCLPFHYKNFLKNNKINFKSNIKI